MRDKELKIIQDFYDFMLWMIKHIEKYPRHHRYSLGLAMENRMQKILELFLKAKYRREKKTILNDVNIELEILRFHSRISTRLSVIGRLNIEDSTQPLKAKSRLAA